MERVDYRLMARRARWRINSRRYRLRHPKYGQHKVVLRAAVDIERVRNLMLIAGLPLSRDACRDEIEAMWATFIGEFIADWEAGRIYRHHR
jgi:hypothetical protein